MHEMVTGFRNGSMKKFGNLGLCLDPFSIWPGPSTCSSGSPPGGPIGTQRARLAGPAECLGRIL